ncbi:MAG: cytochrome [Hyphomicrobiales bacterium]|nr:cytochrome [Hyphomicrobiales bacterium]
MMDSFEFNKIAGAVLGTLLFLMGLGIFSGMIFHPHKPHTPGYDLPVAEAAAKGGAPAAAAAATPVADLLASADPAKGAATAKAACGVCHNFEEGAAVKQGPTLYNVVNRPIAGVAGFAYSSSLQEKSKSDQTWSFEHLNQFITNPKGYASNTKMAFAGEKNEGRRGDILAYLRSLAGSPAPLPAK